MDRTPYQEQIIKRYYEHKPEIMTQKLQELATDLYLATTPKKREQLWKRVALALANLKIPQTQIDAIVRQNDPVVLVRFLERREGNK